MVLCVASTTRQFLLRAWSSPPVPAEMMLSLLLIAVAGSRNLCAWGVSVHVKVAACRRTRDRSELRRGRRGSTDQSAVAAVARRGRPEPARSAVLSGGEIRTLC
jgi:hypothetical protein